MVLMGMTAMVFILEGCQGIQDSLIRTAVDPLSIPDQTYEVTVFRGPMSGSYAVLLDIPEDTIDVFMGYTVFTEKMGLDSSQPYLEELDARTRGYRTLRISSQDGTIRGYLLVSNLLNDRIQPSGEKIMVTIEDPYHGYLRSAP
jgi:hypothetical protein